MMDLSIYLYRRTYIQVVTSLLDVNVVRAREYYIDYAISDHVNFNLKFVQNSVL